MKFLYGTHGATCPNNGTDYHGRCLGQCSECHEHLLCDGRYTPYCPSCHVCADCGVELGAHAPNCDYAQMMRTRYARIIFAQGDDAIEPLAIYDDEGADAAIDYLAQWDCGEYCDLSRDSSAGASDSQVTIGAYVLTVNESLGYIGLELIIEVDE